MPYPLQHQLLTFHWTTGTDEVGQVGIRVARNAPLTQAELDNIHTTWGVFWANPTSQIADRFVFQEVKAATIQPDGKYPPGQDPLYSNGSPVPGGKAGGTLYPLQVTCVATLTTDASRGLASRGRIYLPAIERSMNSNILIPADSCTARAQNLALALSGINTNMTAGGSVSVISNVGVGNVRPVLGVRIGERADIQRRRDRQRGAETYHEASL